MDLVTVVIPAYNAEQWIAEAIESVKKQTYPDIEILVINDGSTDRTGEIAERLGATVKTYHNHGECFASAAGFESAYGKYICRLSADDMFINRDHIEKQVKVLKETGADWCFNTVNRSGTGKHLSRVTTSYLLPVPCRWGITNLRVFDNWILRHPNVALVCVLLRNTINASAMMITQRAYGKVSWRFNERTNCDFLFVVDILKSGLRGVAIHEPGAFYRQHPSQGTNRPEFDSVNKRHHQLVKTMIMKGRYPWWMKVLLRFYHV